MDAPYQIVKAKEENYFALMDTRTNRVIDHDENRKVLEALRNTLNTNWFCEANGI